MIEKAVKVSEQHVWVGVEDQQVHLGLTNYIQGSLGAVIAVELPDVGDPIERGEVFAEIESVSTVHELIAAGIRCGADGESGARRASVDHQRRSVRRRLARRSPLER